MRKRGRTRKSVSTTSDGQSAAKSVPATTEQGSSSVMPEQGSSSLTPESQQRSLKKYSAGGNVTAGDNIQEVSKYRLLLPALFMRRGRAGKGEGSISMEHGVFMSKNSFAIFINSPIIHKRLLA